MRRCAATFANCVLLAAVAAGCRAHSAQSLAPAKPKSPPPNLPIVARSAIEPDASGLTGPTGGPAVARPLQYRKLTAPECRTLAMANAPLADEFDAHPENEAAKHPHLHPTKSAGGESQLGRQVRGYVADDLRNRAAGDALEQFFQLALAEGQYDLLVKSHAELRARLADAEDAVRRGLADRAGVDALRVQVLDLEAKLAQLDASIGALNVSLRARLGLAATDALPLWPDDPLRVNPDDIDLDEAIRSGLFYRPDLNLLRALLAGNGQAGDELIQAVLQQVSPLLARLRSNPLVELLSHAGKGGRAGARRQVESLLTARERQAEAEIRAAAITLGGHRAAATAIASQVRVLTAKVRELEKRAAAGQPVAAELSKAKLDLWKARGDLLKVAVDWKIAEVKRRQAMGGLVRE